MTDDQKQLEFPQGLTDKYRPRRVAGFIGLEKPRKVLRAFLRKPFASSWLFYGPSGTGKTSMALALAASIPAELHHIPSRSCDLETVENTVRTCWFVPMEAQFHLILADEADQMTPPAQLAFLSKMDATAAPPMTILIFTANDLTRFEPRFLSRCRRLDFEAVTLKDQLPRFLAKVAAREGFRFPELLPNIAAESGCNVRDALMRLEVELLSGDRKGLPAQTAPEASEERHSHHCLRCAGTWEHDQGDCALPYRFDCPQCGGGPKTIYEIRAAKAVATRIENIRRQLGAAGGNK